MSNPHIDTTKSPTEVALIQAGQAHRRAVLRSAATRDTLYEAIAKAVTGGLSLQAAADLAGVSKPLAQRAVEKARAA